MLMIDSIRKEPAVTKLLTAIGLMSGTSMDGIDVALLRTDGEAIVERGPFQGFGYEKAFRDRLKSALDMAKSIRDRQERPGDLADIERELTSRHFCRLTALRQRISTCSASTARRFSTVPTKP